MAGEFLIGAIFSLDTTGAVGGAERLGSIFQGLADQMSGMRALGEGLFGGMATAMESVAGGAAAMGDAMGAAFARIESSASASIAAVERLALAMAQVDRGAVGVAGGGGRGGGVFPRPAAPGMRDNGLDIPPPPRTGITEITRGRGELPPRNELSMGEEAAIGAGAGRLSSHAGGVLRGMMPLIAGVSTFVAEKAAMEEDIALRNVLIEGLHLPVNDANMGRLREMSRQASVGTIFSESKTAIAMPSIARELGFTGPEGMEKLGQIFRPALQAAEVAQQTGLGDLHGSLSAGVEFAHMTGAYEPKELEKQLNVLRSVAQLTNQTMRSEETILKYSAPIGMAAGMTPEAITTMTGFIQQQGFNSSTAGTGLSALILGATDTGGALSGHLGATRGRLEKEFAASLRLNPKDAREEHGGGGSKHMQALESLGVTHGGHLTTVDSAGNFDFHALVADIRKYAAEHTKAQVLNTLHAAFGTRGERIAAVLAQPDSDVKMARFEDAINTSPTAADIQGQLSQAPLNQFEQMLANVANIGNTLATTTLTGLNSTFMAMNAGLTGLNNWLQNNPAQATLAGFGLLLGGTLTTLGLFGLAIRGASVGLGIMSAQSAGLAGLGTATATATSGLLGLAGGIARVSGWLSVLSLGGDTPGGAGDDGRAAAQKNPAEWLAWQKAHPNPLTWAWQHTFGSVPGAPDAEHHLGMAPPPIRGYAGNRPDPERHVGGAAPAVTVNISLGGVTNNGVTEPGAFGVLLSKLTDAMTKGIRDALSHTASDPGGSHMSMYTQPGPF